MHCFALRIAPLLTLLPIYIYSIAQKNEDAELFSLYSFYYKIMYLQADQMSLACRTLFYSVYAEDFFRLFNSLPIVARPRDANFCVGMCAGIINFYVRIN